MPKGKSIFIKKMKIQSGESISTEMVRSWNKEYLDNNLIISKICQKINQCYMRKEAKSYIYSASLILKKVTLTILLFFASSALEALPQGSKVVSGQAEMSCTEEKQLHIEASDKAILQYQSFNIDEGEHVRFIQPSSNSTVLNRVIGQDPSKILGNLTSNGRVFLINPNGMLFGPNAVINTGSFLASTLNIKDEDFLNDNFKFYLEPGSEKAKIINQGMISSGAEGFIAIFAPFIENRGSILAKAGKVVLASAEKVTLDFTGDGLIRFTVEGDLKEALIENYGNIESADGMIDISMRSAHKAIKMVVNTEGAIAANDMEEVDGVIRLVSTSHVKANNVCIDGGDKARLDIAGTIDAANYIKDTVGGKIQLLGDQVDLWGTDIDVSGDLGGGEVLIGGNFQGKGTEQNARWTIVDENTVIKADAYTKGDGGKVIVWADDTALFDGKIYARGGTAGGGGGFVETSGKNELGIEVGHVDTSAARGKYGDWLLDPSSVTIQTGGGASLNQVTTGCTNANARVVSPATIAAAASNVAICAQNTANSSITVNNAVTMTNSGISLTLNAGSALAGRINLNANLTTRGAAIVLNGVVTVGATVTLDTTNAGGSPVGGNVTFSNTLNGAQNLTLRGGTGGTVTFTGAVGATTALTSLTATGATITQSSTVKTTGALSYTGSTAINVNGNITTSGGAITMTGPVSVTNTPTFDSTNAGGTAAGATISFSSTLNGATALSLRAGTAGNVSFGGIVGGSSAPTNLIFTSANTIQVGNNISVSGANPLVFGFPVSLTGTSNITSNNANITFSSTVNGVVANTQDLSLTAGTSGNITMTGAVGAITPLRNLTVVSANNWTASAMTTSSIAQSAGSGTTTFNGAINTSGTAGIVLTGTTYNWNANITTTNTGPLTITHTGTLTIGSGVVLNIDGPYTDNGPGPTVYANGFNIITNNSNVTFSSPVSLTGASSVNTGSGVGDITFTSTVDGTQNLTLSSGTGNVVFSGAVGGTTPLNILTISSANNVTAGAISAVSFLQSAGSGTTTFNGAVALSGASGFSFTGNNLTINNTLSTAGNGPASISVSGTFRLGSSGVLSLDGPFTQSGTGMTQSSGSITTTNDNIQFNGVLVLTGATSINSGSGIGDISFGNRVEGSGGLTLTAGTGSITFSNTVGANTRLGALLINSATNITTAAVTASSVNMTSSGTDTLTGNYNTNGSGGIQIVGNTITRSGSITTTGGGSCIFTNAGTLTSSGDYSVDGSITQNGAGIVSLAGNLTANSGNISFLRAITETDSLSLSTGTGGGNITLSRTVNGTVAGSQNITLAAGTGIISLNDNLGSTTRLGIFTINSASNVTIQGSINANSIAQLSGTGTTTINGAITTTTVSGVALAGAAFTLNNTITTTTGSGPMLVTNSGVLTINSGGVLNIGAGFTQNGTGSNILSGSISAGDIISFARAITVSGNPSLTTSSKDINLSSAIDGGGNFTLDAGAGGNITILANIGANTRLGVLTFTNANNITVQNITAASLHQVNGQGTATYLGVNTNGAAGIVENGNNFVRNGTIVTTNGGEVHITNAGTLTVTGVGATVSGRYLQDGAGAVITQGSITTSNQPISFTGAVTLTGPWVLNSGAGAGDITFASTVDGAFPITMTAGTGSITALGNIGNSTRIGAFLVNSCTNISLEKLTAASINITETGGTITFNDDLNTNGIAGIVLNAGNIIRNGSYTATNGGPLIATFSGSTTGSSLTPIRVGSMSITRAGGGSVNFAGSVITDTGGFSCNSPINFLGTASLDTSLSGGDIHFYGTLDGTQDLTLASGSGDIFFDGAVGTTPLGALVITSARNITAAGIISASSITQSAGSGTSIFSGALTTTGSSGISISTSNITRGAAITTTGNGPLTFVLNTGGTLTSTASGNISLDGAFSATGASTISFKGNITTTGDDILFGSVVTLTGASNFTSAGGNISFTRIDGSYDVAITAGTGTMTAARAIGEISRLGAFTVNSSSNCSLQAVTATSISLTQSGVGSIQLNGDLNTNGVAGIAFNGTNIARGGAITATNGGPLTAIFSGSLTGTSPTALRVGSISATNTTPGGVVNFQGTVITDTGGVVYNSPVNLVGPATFDSSAGSGDIHFVKTIDGAQNLILVAGANNIIFDDIIGGTTPLTRLTISSANNVTASGAVSAGVVNQAAGTGLTWFKDNITTTNVSGISLTGNQFQLDKTVSTSNAGSFSVVHTGSLTISSTAALNLDGPLSESGGGGVLMGGSVSTTDDVLNWSGQITLTHDVIINTEDATGANITFGDKIDGAYCLTLTAGSGTIQFNNALGSLSPLNCISATGTTIVQQSSLQTATTVDYVGFLQLNGGITTDNSNITITGNVQLTNNNTITTGSGIGDIAISGTINGNIVGRNLILSAGTGNVTVGGAIGAVVNLNNLTISGTNITWANLGSASIGASGATTLTALGSIIFTGTTYNDSNQLFTAATAFSFTSGAVTNISTSNHTIHFVTGTIELAANTSLNIVSNGGNITLTDLTAIDGATSDLIVNAGPGTLTHGDIGEVVNPLNIVDLTASSITGGVVYATSYATHTTSVLYINADVTITGAILYDSPVVLQNNVSFIYDTCPGGGGSVTFNQTLDGDGVTPRNLTIQPCANAVTFNGPVGSSVPLAAILIDGASDVNINSTMASESLTETGGTGTTTILSALNTTGASGVNLIADTITISGSIITTGGGNITLDNTSGSLSINGIAINSSGFFKQIGSGAVSASGNIQTADDVISFASSLTLDNNLSLNTIGSVGANISYAGTVNGNYNLSMVAGSGSITFDDVLGGVSPLQRITLTSANDVTFAKPVHAASIIQSSGSGLTKFQDTIATTNAAGISLTGTSFQLSGAVTTTNNGPLFVNNSATFTFTGGTGIGSISGALTQVGSGSVFLAGSSTVGGDVSFASSTTLSGATSIDTSATSANIRFTSAINGTYDLTLNSGNLGNLTFGGNVGNTIALGNLTITNVDSFTAQNIIAATITQSAGQTITTLKNLTTSAIGGISLTGTAINISGNIITAALGPVTIVNSGNLDLTLGSSTSITGVFSQSGGSSSNVILGGSLNTINHSITFAKPVNLSANTSLSNGGSGVITFSSTIDGNKNLSITAGSSNIVFSGNIGGGTPLADISVVNCANVSYPLTVASSLTQSASSGTTTIGSTIRTTGALGITIAGTTINQNGALLSRGIGPIIVTNSSSYTMSGSVNSATTFTQNGGGSVALNGSITTANANISFGSDITLAGASIFNSGTGVGDILLSAIVDGNYDLTFTAGSGIITFGDNIGSNARIGKLTINSGSVLTIHSILAASISQLSGSGSYGDLNTNVLDGIVVQGSSFTLAGNLTTTNSGSVSVQNSGDLVVTGASSSIDGSFNQIGLGTTTIATGMTTNGFIQFQAPIVLSGISTLVSTSNPITFLNTVNGSGNLSINSGLGDILFNTAIGESLRIGALTIQSADNVTGLGIKAASITQSAGTGLTTLLGDLNTNAIEGINLTGSNFTIDGSLISTNGGPCAINHTGVLSLVAGSSSLLSGPFTESGIGGSVTLSGLLHASNANVIFNNPITLVERTTLNSNEGGDILIASTIDGPYDLIYTAGTGNITLAAPIGGTTPVLSLTITTAQNVTTDAISAGKIIQSSGSGLSTFNGNLTTTVFDGINLTGNQFSFGSSVTTSGGGIVSINNAGQLTMPQTSSFMVDGAFSQTGSGPVSLCTTITTTGDDISFAAPIALCNNASLDTGGLFGDIVISSAVNGAYDFTLSAGQGNITLSSPIGGSTPLHLFEVSSCLDLTSGVIKASTIDVEGVLGLATFNGILETTSSSGITLVGAAFTLNGNVTTTGTGPLSITNSSFLTIPSSITLSVDGAFDQLGGGVVSIGGIITTNAQDIAFSGPMQLTGNISLTSSNGDITLGSDLEGSYSIIMTAGSGDITVPSAISLVTPLINFTVVSAYNISLHGIGTPSNFMGGTLSLTASNTISMYNTTYSTHTQYYNSGADLDFINPGLVTLYSNGGNIIFASTSTHLNNVTDLAINTSGGEFSFVAIHGTNFENLTINTGSGLANLGSLPNVGNINTVVVRGGQIILNGAMNLVNTDFISQGSILNSGSLVDIVSSNTATFNALGGNVGSLSSPILVHTDNQIYAGGIDLADFNGSSIDDTVHEIPSNPPCEIIWNGVVIKKCNPPPPPTPPTPKPGPNPTPPAPPSIFVFRTPVPGVESSYFTLANDLFFMPYFLDDSYINRPRLLYWRLVKKMILLACESYDEKPQNTCSF